jgi:molybdate transport system substrate-binding protein
MSEKNSENKSAGYLTRLLFSVFLLTFSFPQNSLAAQNGLTVFAEPNMVLPLTKIARLYSQKYGIAVSVIFGAPIDLLENVESGEPVDVFISAHTDWIESLRQKGLADVYNIGYIASDKMALVTSRSNPEIIPELLDPTVTFDKAMHILNDYNATIITDNIGTSSGKFSDAFMKRSDLVNISLFHKVIEDKSPILNNLKKENQNYGLVLTSQIEKGEDLRIIAIKEDEEVFYQALVIAGDNMQIAREFLKFLKSAQAKFIFKNEGGFIVDHANKKARKTFF